LVLDHPLVGGLGLLGELALGLAHRLAGALDAGGRLGVLRRAGGQFELPELPVGERGLLVGVILASGEHAPEQDRQLARGGNDRLAVTASGAGALVERRIGPGWRATCHAASTSAQRAVADPRLEIRPLRAGASPDWRTFGSSPR
jgi:hypothetical protein